MLTIDFNQLYYFIVTAETGHLTHAAEKLALSQSALSRSIANLEAELGVPLFDRVNRTIKLNHFGKVFLATALDVRQQMQSTENKLQSLAHPDYDDISLSFLRTLGLAYIPYLLKAFCNKYPTNHVKLSERTTLEVMEDVANGDADVGICAKREAKFDLTFHPLLVEKMVFIVSVDHPLAKREQISFQDISETPFIHFNKNTYSRVLVEEMLAAHHIKVTTYYEGLEIASMIGLVKANMGIAIIPESTSYNLQNIRTFPIEHAASEQTIYLIHRTNEDLPRVVEQFISFCLHET